MNPNKYHVPLKAMTPKNAIIIYTESVIWPQGQRNPTDSFVGISCQEINWE